MTMVKELTAERDRLRAALEEAKEDILSFGNHDWDCKFMLSNFSETCSCWHQTSINAIDEALKGQP